MLSGAGRRRRSRGSTAAERRVSSSAEGATGGRDVGRRQFAAAVLEDLPAAEDAVRTFLGDPVARPYAADVARVERARGGRGHRHAVDDALLFVEMVGVILDHVSPDVLVAQLPGEGQDVQVDRRRRPTRRVDP